MAASLWSSCARQTLRPRCSTPDRRRRTPRGPESALDGPRRQTAPNRGALVGTEGELPGDHSGTSAVHHTATAGGSTGRGVSSGDPAPEALECWYRCGRRPNQPFHTCCAACPSRHTALCWARQRAVRARREARAAAQTRECVHSCGRLTWRRDVGGAPCCMACAACPGQHTGECDARQPPEDPVTRAHGAQPAVETGAGDSRPWMPVHAEPGLGPPPGGGTIHSC